MMHIPDLALPEGLYDRIIARIADAKRRSARLQFAVLAGLSAGLTGLLVLAAQYAMAESALSGFGSYLSLLLSDSTLVLTSRDFILSLVDSLPALALLLLLATSGALAWSLYRTAQTARTAFNYV